MTRYRRSLLSNPGGDMGFTILEVLVASMILAIVFLGIAPFFAARFGASRTIAESSIAPIIGRGIADAIAVGAREHFDPVHNILFFDYEGVRIEIDLPEPFETREYPGIVIRDSRDGVVSSTVDPGDVLTVPLGGFALSHGVIIRPGPDHILGPGTVPAGDDRRVGLGLYPLGPVANVSPRPRPVRRDGLLETVVLPIAERDVNGNGTFDPVENWNGSWTKIGGVQVRALDTYEDTGPDGLLSRDEPGYDLVLNPDPAGDDFDPVLNPSGPEGNGRLDRREDQNGDFYLCVPDLQLDEDRNSNGLLDGPERDLNGNNLISHRRIRIADRPPLSLSIGQNEDPADPNVNPVYPSPRDPVRSLGYSLVVRRPSDASIYVFRIMIYRSFLEARVSFSQATPLRHLLVSTPEVGDRARNLEDDDRDGIIDDGPDHPFGSPELTLDGIDDDGDGVIDDGLLLPTHVHTFVLRVESGTGVGAPGDPR